MLVDRFFDGSAEEAEIILFIGVRQVIRPDARLNNRANPYLGTSSNKNCL